MFALYFSKRIVLSLLCAAALAAIPAVTIAQDQDDPPPEAGRISYVSGNVSIQPVTSDEWGQAYPNLPLGPGDRIFTDNDGRVEVQVGRTYVRIGPNSDVTLVDDSQFNINFGVAQGSVRLHSFELWPRQLLDISTPNGNAEFGHSGDMRVDVFPNDGATVFTNLGQFADITAAGDFRQQLDYGQSLELAGSNPVDPQWLQPANPDELDSWSQGRDQQLARVVSFNYVSPDIPGAADLDAYGEWQPQTEYGAVWFPRDVSADWEPYHNGHWINREPWGWVWVEDEPWGYAPFHYGRWVSYNGRWGWVPGPVNVRPIWSPALVVFAGGVQIGGGGGGLSAWFPLGPGEAYRPWYRCSPRYIDQVNITNIREAPRVRVQKTYVNIVNVTNVTYINQSRGVTAMRREDFASGRPVRNVAVRVDPREIQHIQPLARPEVAAPARPIITRPVAHPVPVSVHRPVLINQQGKQIVARPGAAPVAPPVKPVPPVRALPGRTIVAAPAHQVPNRPGVQGPNQFPAAQGNQQQRPNNVPNQQPGGAPRANPVGQVPGYQRGISPQPGNQQPNANQPAGNPNGPPSPEPRGRPLTPPNQQQPNQPNDKQPNRPNQQPNANQPAGNPNGQPPGQPTGRPLTPPNYQQQNQPNRPNYQQPNQPNDRQPNRPNQPPNPNQPAGNPSGQPPQPTGRPLTPPNYQQPNQPNDRQPTRPNQQPNANQPAGNPSGQPPQPTGRPMTPPNYQQQENRQQENRPVQQPPRPNQPPTPPPSQNRQDFGPVQPDKHRNEAPPPPANNTPQGRPMEQQRPVPPPQARPTPPPPPDRSTQQQNKSREQSQKQNDNKDQKKNDKKDDKKHD